MVCYERVSTEGQAGPDRYSLATQRDICHRKALELGATSVEHLEDTYTGTELDRPAMTRLLQLVERREVDAVVFLDVDRVGRNALDILTVDRRLARAGVARHFALGNWQSSEQGKLLLHIHAAIAEEEHDKILERTTRGKRQKAAAGRLRTWTRLYGYRFRKGEGRLEVDPAERRVVQQIFAWCAEEGLGSVEIARRLTERGVPSPRAGMRSRQGVVSGAWRHEQIWAMLRNRTYVDGEIIRPDALPHWAPVRTEPLVPRPLWERVQAVCARRARGGARRTRQEYLLQGLLECGRCGRALGVRSRSAGAPGGRSWRYYHCPGHSASGGGLERCPQMPLPAGSLEDLVWGLLAPALGDVRRHLLELRRGGDAALAGLQQRRQEAEGRRLQAQAALERVHQAWGGGALHDQGQYTRLIADWERRLALAVAEAQAGAEAHRRLAAGLTSPAGLHALAAEMADRLRGAPFAKRRLVVQRLLRRVVVTDRRVLVEGHVELGAATGSIEKRAMGKIDAQVRRDIGR